MERLGIFGGTFNPVHKEHLNIVKAAIKELKLDKLIVMPDFIPPHKQDVPASAEDRLNMLKLAFNGIDRVEISDFEINKKGKSYTYLTITHFRENFDGELYFIVGGDMLINFKNWKNPQTILDNCKLAVFDREGVNVDYKSEQEYFKKTFNSSFIKLKYNGKDASSTKIRIYSSLDLPLDGLTTKEVEQYINEKGLYKGGEHEKFIIDNLTGKRRIHTAGVILSALTKCEELNLDKTKVKTACLLHDCAKYLSPEDYYKSGFKLDDDIPEPVIHAFLGAFVAENVLKVTDYEILDAIRYHTSGKENMSLLGKLVFVADMVEENREYDVVDLLRKAYKGNFSECFILCLEEEMIHLKRKGGNIYKKTVDAYNYYVNRKENL